MSFIPALGLAVALLGQTRFDAEGFPLPHEAIRRLGSARFLTGDWVARCLGYAADGRTLFTADFSVTAWDATSGRVRWSYSLPGAQFQYPNSILGRDGKIIWVVAYPEYTQKEKKFMTVYRLSTADGSRIGQTKLENHSVSDLSPTGRLVLLHDDKKRRQVDVRDGVTGRSVGFWDVPEKETVRGVAITSDGQRLAIGSTLRGDNGPIESHIRIMDLATSQIERTISVGQSIEGLRFILRFAPDGRRLYALIVPAQWVNRGMPDSSLFAWDLRTGAALFRFAVKSNTDDMTEARPSTLAVSSDGKTAVLGDWDRPTTMIYDLPSGKLHCSLPLYAGHAPIFDPTGKILAFGGAGITQWDVATGKRCAYSPPPCPSGRLIFSADGQRLICQSYGVADTVEWNFRTGREVKRISWPDAIRRGRSGSTGAISPFGQPIIVRSPNGSLIARFVAHPENWQHPDNGKIILTDGLTRKHLRTLPSAGNMTYGLAFSADGRFLATDGYASVTVYDTTTGKVSYKITPQHDPNSGGVISGGGRLYPCPDGRHLAIRETNTTGSAYHWSIGLYDFPTGKEVRRFRGMGTLNAVAWSADGTRIAATGKLNDLADGKQGVLFVGDRTTTQPPLPTMRMHQSGGALAFSPDGRTLAVAAGEHIRLWEVASGKVRHTFVGHRVAANSLAFSLDGRYLAALSPDAPVFLWDVRGELSRSKTVPNTATLEHAWADLTRDDAAQAFQSLRWLADFPEQTLPFLKRKLDQVKPPQADSVPTLIKQLDAPAFADRQRAEAELRKLLEVAAPALRKAASNSPSPEVRQRAERLLKIPVPMTAERLRLIRAIEAIGWIGTPEAIGVLQHFARGSAGMPLTTEAQAAVARLRKEK